MEEIKTVATLKHDFEGRGKSQVSALFGLIGLSGSWGKDQNKKFFR